MIRAVAQLVLAAALLHTATAFQPRRQASLLQGQHRGQPRVAAGSPDGVSPKKGAGKKAKGGGKKAKAKAKKASSPKPGAGVPKGSFAEQEGRLALFAELVEAGAPGFDELAAHKSDWTAPPPAEYSDKDLDVLRHTMDFLQGYFVSCVSGDDLDPEEDPLFIAEGRKLIALETFVVTKATDDEALLDELWMSIARLVLAAEPAKAVAVVAPSFTTDVDVLLKKSVNPTLVQLGLGDAVKVEVLSDEQGSKFNTVRVFYKVELDAITKADGEDGDEVADDVIDGLLSEATEAVSKEKESSAAATVDAVRDELNKVASESSAALEEAVEAVEALEDAAVSEDEALEKVVESVDEVIEDTAGSADEATEEATEAEEAAVPAPAPVPAPEPEIDYGDVRGRMSKMGFGMRDSTSDFKSRLNKSLQSNPLIQRKKDV